MWKKVEPKDYTIEKQILCWDSKKKHMFISNGVKENTTHWRSLPQQPLTDEEEDFNWKFPLTI